MKDNKTKPDVHLHFVHCDAKLWEKITPSNTVVKKQNRMFIPEDFLFQKKKVHRNINFEKRTTDLENVIKYNKKDVST